MLAGDVAATSETFVDQLSEEVLARNQQLEFAAFFDAAQHTIGVARGEN